MKKIILLLSLLSLQVGLRAATTASVDQSTLRCVQLIKPETQKTLQLVCNIQDGVQRLMYCIPIAITGNTTIDTPGIYCVANTSAPAITIEVSDVLVDLNGYSSSGVLIYGAQTLNNITVKNGLIEGDGTDNGLLAIDARNVTVQDVTARNGQKGFYFNGVSNSRIIDSAVEGNTIGVMFTDSHKNNIDNVVASSNVSAGFSLISSATNCFKECKAVNTGEGNTQVLNNEVFGFVSQDGHNNIFERCIANATQAYSTTDSQSVVAGFALRGNEKCTKIIDSEAANSTTSANGVTVPYGILLQAELDSNLTLTGVPPLPTLNNIYINDLSWRGDGKYLATGDRNNGMNSGTLRVFEFDRNNVTLTSVATAVNASFGIRSMDWHPNGIFIAVGDDTLTTFDPGNVRLFKFDSTDLTLTEKQVISLSSFGVEGVRWSPDGNYLLVTDTDGTDANVRIYSFDAVAQTLTQVDSVSISNERFGNGGTLSWRPDGAYIGVGSVTGILHIYSFENDTITPIATDSLNAIFGLQWSHNGKYIGVSNSTGSNGQLYVYGFEDSGLTQLSMIDTSHTFAVGVTWSADDIYLATGDTNITTTGITRVYQFDPGSNSIILEASSGVIGNFILSLEFSPDGGYIAVGAGFDDPFALYRALNFPSKNVITNNTVYCNSGGSCPSGVGISGSSIQNMIIGNTAYSNPIPQSANHPIVESNYYFVTNVFNQLFGNAPSDLQNIALGGCEPICMPEDLGLLIKQNQSLILANCSKLDVIIGIVSAL